MALNEKQNRFVQEYLIDLNATAAAKRAGYSEKTAYSQGQRLLKNVEVQAALQDAVALREKRTSITQDKVLTELARIAFANGTDYARVVHNKQGLAAVDLTDTDALDDDKKAAISCIKEGKFGIEVSSYDKLRALELLGKHLGMFGEHAGGGGGPENNLLEAIQSSLQEDIDTNDISEIQ